MACFHFEGTNWNASIEEARFSPRGRSGEGRIASLSREPKPDLSVVCARSKCPAVGSHPSMQEAPRSQNTTVACRLKLLYDMYGILHRLRVTPVVSSISRLKMSSTIWLDEKALTAVTPLRFSSSTSGADGGMLFTFSYINNNRIVYRGIVPSVTEVTARLCGKNWARRMKAREILTLSSSH